LKPEKVHPGQVDIFFAHEAPGTFGTELRRHDVMDKFDYAAYFDHRHTAIWWPFGPSLNSMVEHFPAYSIPHSERIPAVAWLAIDCLPPRSAYVSLIAEHFPLFSMGSCKNNFPAPVGLPGRGIENLQYQTIMAHYMFYFAMENAPACEGYMTEKVWMALERGSIPIYMGAEGFENYMPTNTSYLDMTKFASVSDFVRELRAIAEDEEKYLSYTSWRYQNPSTWSPGFRRLLRVMSTDIKVGVCSVLQKGESEYPRSTAQLGTCERPRILGTPLTYSNPGMPRSPLDFLDQTCNELHRRCYTQRDTPLDGDDRMPSTAQLATEASRAKRATAQAEAAA
jgi:hypothetical protein